MQVTQLAQGLNRRQLWGRDVQDSLQEVVAAHQPLPDLHREERCLAGLSPQLPRYVVCCSRAHQ